MLRDTHGTRAERLCSAFHPVRGSEPANPEHGEHAETILDALMHGHRLRGTYELLSTGSVHSYDLRPLSLVVSHEGLHLLAKKRDGKVRMFDVEGFKQIARVRKATAPPDGTVQGHFAAAFGRHTHYEVATVVLQLRGIAARQLRRRRYHGSQTALSDEDGELTARFTVGLCPEFEAWLLGLAPNVVVVEPDNFRERLRKRHLDGATANAR